MEAAGGKKAAAAAVVAVAVADKQPTTTRRKIFKREAATMLGKMGTDPTFFFVLFGLDGTLIAIGSNTIAQPFLLLSCQRAVGPLTTFLRLG